MKNLLANTQRATKKHCKVCVSAWRVIVVLHAIGTILFVADEFELFGSHDASALGMTWFWMVVLLAPLHYLIFITVTKEKF